MCRCRVCLRVCFVCACMICEELGGDLQGHALELWSSESSAQEPSARFRSSSAHARRQVGTEVKTEKVDRSDKTDEAPGANGACWQAMTKCVAGSPGVCKGEAGEAGEGSHNLCHDVRCHRPGCPACRKPLKQRGARDTSTAKQFPASHTPAHVRVHAQNTQARRALKVLSGEEVPLEKLGGKTRLQAAGNRSSARTAMIRTML